MLGGSFTNIGILLIVAGFLLAFVAAAIMALRSRGGDGQTKSAGIILIGPIPIIFGSDRDSTKTLVVLAIILIVVVLVSILIPTLIMNR